MKNISTMFALFIGIVIIVRPVYAEANKDIDKELVIRNAVVKIYTVANPPDYFKPWNHLGPFNVSGSGAIVKGNRILTNAHVVADHTFIQVRKYGEAKRYKAKVLVVSHESDLAFLTVEDRSFFSDIVPLELSDLPRAQQEVTVYGYPLGGDALSVTKGILSRIEHQFYNHSTVRFLAGQIDAAINKGNSGGPVIVKGRIVGVVMQTIGPKFSENIGYMVPTPIIEHFILDLEDGQYDGFPNIGLSTQTMENPGMRARYKMLASQTGVIVNHVLLGAPAEGIIEVDDVIMSIEGHPIADDGTVEFRTNERTSFAYYVEGKQMGKSVNLELLRQGVTKKVTVKLNRREAELLLVTKEQYDRSPRYFIYGGYVFSPLTYNVVKRWGKDWKNKAPKPLVMALWDWTSKDKKEVVVLLQTLPSDINKGYHQLKSWIIHEINGETFKDFNEFYRRVYQTREKFIVLKGGNKFQVVIDREDERRSHQMILDTYQIRHDRSPDLR